MQGFIIELKLNASITVNIIHNLFNDNTLETIYCEKNVSSLNFDGGFY